MLVLLLWHVTLLGWYTELKFSVLISDGHILNQKVEIWGYIL